MTRMERFAVKAGVNYRDASANEVLVLGEDAFDKVASLIFRSGSAFHGYKTGAYDEESGEYWWCIKYGPHPNPIRAELIANNID